MKKIFQAVRLYFLNTVVFSTKGKVQKNVSQMDLDEIKIQRESCLEMYTELLKSPRPSWVLVLRLYAQMALIGVEPRKQFQKLVVRASLTSLIQVDPVRMTINWSHPDMEQSLLLLQDALSSVSAEEGIRGISRQYNEIKQFAGYQNFHMLLSQISKYPELYSFWKKMSLDNTIVRGSYVQLGEHLN